MSIDNFTSDGLNIKDLVTADPARKEGLPFDFGKLISPTRVSEWIDYVKVNLNSASQQEYFRGFGVAADVTILFPEKKHELSLPPIDQLFEKNRERGPKRLTELIILYPNEYRSYIDKLPTFEEKKEIIEQHEDAHDVWETFLLYPDRWSEIQDIPGLADLWKDKAESYKDLGPLYFAWAKLTEKLLSKNKTDLTQEEWDPLIQSLESERVVKGLDAAVLIKLLAAKEIKMTPVGLQVVMPEVSGVQELRDEPVPERRKF